MIKNKISKIKKIFYLLSISFFLVSNISSAQIFSSSNYSVENPVFSPGGYSASTNFKLTGSVSQIAIGSSTSATYGGLGGFLYFPFVSTPAVSTTAGDSQISLSWTSATGALGWDVSGYYVGQSTAPGGPYTYTNVGNTLSSVRTGLANGTTYYFVIRVTDSFGNFIATSTEVSATPVGSSSGGGGGGGGGGGSSSGSSSGGVNFSGRAYPLSKITILKDGQIVLTTIADPLSNFSATLSGLSTGNHNFSVYGEDSNNRRSSHFTFPIYITGGVTTNIGGIFIAPTIAVDKSQVKKGDSIAIFGQSAPSSEVTISINSAEEFFVKRPTDKDGVYLLNFDTSVLELGDHHTRSKSQYGEEISQFSSVIGFKVGNENIETKETKKTKGDLNGDNRINLVDFSIAAFWYKKTLSESFKQKERDFMNGDGKVDLVDFSIMAYNWTG